VIALAMMISFASGRLRDAALGEGLRLKSKRALMVCVTNNDESFLLHHLTE